MINYPGSLDDNDSLFLAVNDKRTFLTSDIDDSTLTIPVVTTSGFPPTGFISILTGLDITQTEAIKYDSLTPTQFNATSRGADGSEPRPHRVDNNVDFTIVAAHHNEPKDAIIELEKRIGPLGFENFVIKDAAGNVVISGALTVSGLGTFFDLTAGDINAGDVAVSNSLTVSGVPVITDTSPFEIPDPLTLGTINATTSLTISGVPVVTGTGGLAEIPDPLVLSTMTATQSLTVSGVPVATGTFDPASLDDLYVNETGDTMSGDLDMDGNIVRNAGVVIIQPDVPTITPSGLLWYDTDEGCDFTVSPLPGGVRAATVITSSGVSVPDDIDFTMIWDTEKFDWGNWFDPLYPSRLTVPSGINHVQLTAGAQWQAASGTRRHLEIIVNGTTVVAGEVENSAPPTVEQLMTVVTPVIATVGGDFFEVQVRQTAGLPLNIESDDRTFFSVLATDSRGVPGVNTVNLLQGDVTLVAGSGVSISADAEVNEITISQRTTSYTHIQSTASGTWVIPHNLISEAISYTVLDNSGSQVIPDTFLADNVNQATITFVSPQAGKAHIFVWPGV